MGEQSTKNQEFLRREYVGRINRVLDYIEAHLDQDLSLEGIAQVASFSRFHFHRIFKSIVGETLNHFIKRRRVEKAAAQLVGNPHKTITEIALDCGFSGSASFARSFKDIFQMSATEWRERGLAKSKIGEQLRKNGKSESNHRKEFDVQTVHSGGNTTTLHWRLQMKKDSKTAMDVKVEVKDMPDFNVVYVRHVGPYQGDSSLFGRLIGRLCGWAGPRGLMGPDSKMLMVYHDDPNVTDDEKLRVDVCLTVPADTAVDGDIGAMVIPGGQFGVGHFEIDETQYGDAWDALMAGWMPGSGYQPDDRLCYEMCLNNPEDHPEKKHIVDICVPVRPL